MDVEIIYRVGNEILTPGEVDQNFRALQVAFAGIPSQGSGGSVTSVGLLMPNIFTVTNSPVITSGNLTATLNTQAANMVFASPISGSAGVPSFRSLVIADIPTISIAKGGTGLSTIIANGLVLSSNGTIYLGRQMLPANNKVSVAVNTNDYTFGINEGNLILSNMSGTLPQSKGGTGFTSANNGELLIGNGSGFSKATLTSSDSSVIITNTAGGIDLKASSASNAFVQFGNAFGVTAVMGTTDAKDLSIIVGGSEQLKINATTGFAQFTTGIVIPATTSTAGIIYQGANRMFHTYGTDNLFFGRNAGNLTSTGTGINTGFGINNLTAITTGNQCVAIGSFSQYSATTTNSNTTLGYATLGLNVASSRNIAIGAFALNSYNSTGTGANIYIGYTAGFATISGIKNTVTGYQAGYRNETGNNNTLYGYNSGFGVASNSYSDNSFYGYLTGQNVTTGSQNTFVGSTVGSLVTTGSNNILVGYNIDLPLTTTSNYMSLGNIVFATGVNGTGSAISTALVGIGNKAPTKLLHVGTSGSVTGSFWIDDTNSYLTNNFTGSDQLYYIANTSSSGNFLFQIQSAKTSGVTQVRVINDNNVGLAVQSYGTAYTDSNVWKKNRSVLTCDAADGLHFYVSASNKPFDFWVGSTESTAKKIMELVDGSNPLKVYAAGTQILGLDTNGLGLFEAASNPIASLRIDRTIAGIPCSVQFAGTDGSVILINGTSTLLQLQQVSSSLSQITTNSTALKIQSGSTAAGIFTTAGFAINSASVTTAPTSTLHVRGSLGFQVLVSAAATLTLGTNAKYVFSGTTATWSLPVVGTTDRIYFVKNRGSGILTINVTGGGTTIYNTSAVTSLGINPGEAYIFSDDGTYWITE